MSAREVSFGVGRPVKQCDSGVAPKLSRASSRTAREAGSVASPGAGAARRRHWFSNRRERRGMLPERALLFTLLFGLSLFRPWAVAAQSSDEARGGDDPARPTLRAAALAVAQITPDGRLDEAVWATADSISRLTEVEPGPSGVPSARTVVKVLASPGEIVIGVIAYQAAGVPIVSHAKAPDSELRSEDHIQVVLDTFLDGRGGYVFAVNPSGARYDALVTNQGEKTQEDSCRSVRSGVILTFERGVAAQQVFAGVAPCSTTPPWFSCGGSGAVEGWLLL